MGRLLGETDQVCPDPTVNDPLLCQPSQLVVNLGGRGYNLVVLQLAL